MSTVVRCVGTCCRQEQLVLFHNAVSTCNFRANPSSPQASSNRYPAQTALGSDKCGPLPSLQRQPMALGSRIDAAELRRSCTWLRAPIGLPAESPNLPATLNPSEPKKNENENERREKRATSCSEAQPLPAVAFFWSFFAAFWRDASTLLSSTSAEEAKRGERCAKAVVLGAGPWRRSPGTRPRPPRRSV